MPRASERLRGEYRVWSAVQIDWGFYYLSFGDPAFWRFKFHTPWNFMWAETYETYTETSRVPSKFHGLFHIEFRWIWNWDILKDAGSSQFLEDVQRFVVVVIWFRRFSTLDRPAARGPRLRCHASREGTRTALSGHWDADSEYHVDKRRPTFWKTPYRTCESSYHFVLTALYNTIMCVCTYKSWLHISLVLAFIALPFHTGLLVICALLMPFGGWLTYAAMYSVWLRPHLLFNTVVTFSYFLVIFCC